ncbi:MAG: carboxypeptidase-like regulatory domain-containing protein [bacterium]|nr:carboxypeptidase-like regulatory domain-containing protein [bacterium]
MLATLVSHTTPAPARVASHTDAGLLESTAFDLNEPGQVVRLGEHRLAPAAVVAGTVRDAENTLQPGIRVELRTDSWSHETVTDRAGRYRFNGVPSGEYHIDLIADQRPKEALRSAPFSLAPGRQLERDLVPPQP